MSLSPYPGELSVASCRQDDHVFRNEVGLGQSGAHPSTSNIHPPLHDGAHAPPAPVRPALQCTASRAPKKPQRAHAAAPQEQGGLREGNFTVYMGPHLLVNAKSVLGLLFNSFVENVCSSVWQLVNK